MLNALRLLLQLRDQLQDLGALPGQVERIEDLVQRRTAPRDLSSVRAEVLMPSKGEP